MRILFHFIFLCPGLTPESIPKCHLLFPPAITPPSTHHRPPSTSSLLAVGGRNSRPPPFPSFLPSFHQRSFGVETRPSPRRCLRFVPQLVHIFDTARSFLRPTPSTLTDTDTMSTQRPTFHSTIGAAFIGFAVSCVCVFNLPVHFVHALLSVSLLDYMAS